MLSEEEEEEDEESELEPKTASNILATSNVASVQNNNGNVPMIVT